MAKGMKPILKKGETEKQSAEPSAEQKKGALPKEFGEKQPLSEPRHEPEKKEEFNWKGFLVPSSEKLLLFALLFVITAACFGAVIYFRGGSFEEILPFLFGAKLLHLVALAALTYACACYAVERKMGWVRPALLVFLPELLIVLYVLLKMPSPARAA
jgi:hypothetical protein